MLDQNTDRMWFVIGAVIVGAAIIFIANGTIPEIFASVTESFEESASKASAVIDVIGAEFTYGENLIDPSQSTSGYWLNATDGAPRYTSDYYNRGGSGYIEIEPNTTYSFRTPENTLNKRMLFYDENKEFIKGYLNKAEGEWNPPHKDKFIVEMKHRSPSNARYARVSTRFQGPDSAPFSDWQFSEVIYSR